MIKEITFVLTLFEPSIREIDNYLFSFKKINEIYYKNKSENPIDFLIISDNPNISKELIDYIDSNIINHENIEFIKSDQNRVRLGQLFYYLDKINSKFVKTVDPDDYLDPQKTVDFVKNTLPLTSENNIIVYNYTRVKNFDIHYELIDYCEKEIFYKKQPFNPNSIYPTKILRQINWDEKILIWSDDLIAFLLVKNGASIFEDRNSNFYINLAHGGVSVTDDYHKNMRFYNDSIRFLERSIEEIGDDKFLKEAFILLTSKPSYWFHRQIFRDLYYNISISRFTKIRLANNIFKYSEKIKKLNGRYFWYKFGIRVLFLFNIKW